ncbi:hypothetical protein ACFCX4_28495, partial [Kitasatospora sp. NPDC056327]
GSAPSAPAGAPAAGSAPGAGAGAAAGVGALPEAGAGTICDQAERLGRWPAGSEQARMCHSIYG